MQYIDRMESLTGNNPVDFIILKDGRVLGIDAESVVLYASMDDFHGYATINRPSIDLVPIMTFLHSGDSRETSPEIIAAIWTISNKSDADAERIWSEPDPDELLAIWEIVTKNGLRAAADYYWGASGYQWDDAV